MGETGAASRSSSNHRPSKKMLALLYFVASALGLIGAVLCYRANARYRGMIEDCLGPGMKVPERVFPFYDAAYLNSFIRTANGIPAPSGKSVLSLYIQPVLLWIDVGFAVFCAGFAAFFWLGLLELHFNYGWLESAVRFFLLMAVLYGFADVVEDLWLARLFSKRGPVNRQEGMIACVLTQTKLLTIVLSIVGGLFFLVLSRIFSKPS